MSLPLFSRRSQHDTYSQFDLPPRAPPVPPKGGPFNIGVSSVKSNEIGRESEKFSSRATTWENREANDPLIGIFDKSMRFFAETWAIEIISMGMSLCSLAGLVALLMYYDGEESPKWSVAITLNAILSVSVTVMIATLTMTISSGLGQLKWTRALKAPITLSQLDIIDQASRGMWGSVMVIFTWSGGVLGAIGAFAFILTLIVAPLAQQSIQTSSERALASGNQTFITTCNGSDALDRNARIEPPGDSFFRKGDDNQLPSQMRGAYYNALYGNFDNASISDSFAACPTKNCTWEPFPTLAICTECKNVTNMLKFHKNASEPSEERAFLKDGPIWTPVLIYNITSMEVKKNDTSSNLPLYNGTILHFAGVDGSTAVECTLTFCVQVVEAVITNGLLKETVIEKHLESTFEVRSRRDVEEMMFKFYPPDTSQANSTAFTVPMTVNAFDPITISEAMTFYGAVGSAVSSTPETLILGLAGNGNLTSTFEDVGLAMSRALRIVASGSNRIPGLAWDTVTIVHVEWYWLIAPFLVEFLGLVFFLGIMLANARSVSKLWKTSLLATCYHGPKFADDLQGASRSMEGLHVMTDEAEKILVQLVPNNNSEGVGSRLMPQIGLSTK